jgi:hypothetical protein
MDWTGDPQDWVYEYASHTFVNRTLHLVAWWDFAAGAFVIAPLTSKVYAKKKRG